MSRNHITVNIKHGVAAINGGYGAENGVGTVEGGARVLKRAVMRESVDMPSRPAFRRQARGIARGARDAPSRPRKPVPKAAADIAKSENENRLCHAMTLVLAAACAASGPAGDTWHTDSLIAMSAPNQVRCRLRHHPGRQEDRAQAPRQAGVPSSRAASRDAVRLSARLSRPCR